MRNKIFFAISLIVFLLAVAVFFTRPTRLHGQATNPHSMEVRVDNFTFAPDTLTVPVNSAVTWVNKDDIPHVIASNDGLFKSKALDTDQEYSYTFTKPGTYEYYCSIHPKMTGKIVVQ